MSIKSVVSVDRASKILDEDIRLNEDKHEVCKKNEEIRRRLRHGQDPQIRVNGRRHYDDA